MNEEEFRDKAIALLTEQTIYMKVMCKENQDSHKEIKDKIDDNNRRLVAIGAVIGVILTLLTGAAVVV